MEIELPRLLPPCPVASQISGGMDNRSPPTKKRGRGRRQRGRGTGRRTGRWRTRQHAPPPTRARGAQQWRRGRGRGRERGRRAPPTTPTLDRGPAPTHHHNDGGLFCSERPPYPTDRYSQRGKQKNHGLVDDPRIRCTWTSFCVLGSTYFGTLHVQYLSIQK